MNIGWRQINRAMALMLACAVSQVYVFGTAPSTESKIRADATSSAPAETIFGMLVTRGSKSTTINGEECPSGTTVRSGSQLQTGEQAGATVQLGVLGTLDIAPNTNLTLNFDKRSVNVKITTGNASLTTNEGVAGSVENAGDATKLNDFAQTSSARDQDRDHGDDTGEGVLGNLTNNQSRNFALIVYAALVATAVIVVATRGRGRNPSPGIPRRSA